MMCLKLQDRGYSIQQTKFKMKICQVLFLILFIPLCNNVFAQKPADGIGWAANGANIEFWPTCNSTKLDSSTLELYHWFWDFGNGDYSFDYYPKRSYREGMTLNGVRLEISNIKDDEPEKPASTILPGCPSGNCGALKPRNNVEAAPGKIWKCTVAEPTVSFAGQGYANSNNYEFSIEESYLPKPEHKVRYAVRVKRNSDPNDRGNHSVEFKFLTQGPIGYGNNTEPVSWPANLTLNSSHGKTEVASLVMSPGSEQVVILEYEVPKSAQLRDSVKVDVEITVFDTLILASSSASDNEGKPRASFVPISADSNLSSTHLVTSATLSNKAKIAAAWDPNFIVSYPSGKVGPGEKILYHVNFQNDGNAPTQNVVLRLGLPQQLESFQVIGNTFGNHVMVDTALNIGVSSGYQVYFNNSTVPLRYAYHPLDSGANASMYILGVVKNDPDLCGEDMKASMRVEFDKPANAVIPPDDLTRITCPPESCIEEPIWSHWVFWLLILLLLILLIIVIVLAARRRSNPNPLPSGQPIPQP